MACRDRPGSNSNRVFGEHASEHLLRESPTAAPSTSIVLGLTGEAVLMLPAPRIWIASQGMEEARHAPTLEEYCRGIFRPGRQWIHVMAMRSVGAPQASNPLAPAAPTRAEGAPPGAGAMTCSAVVLCRKPARDLEDLDPGRLAAIPGQGGGWPGRRAGGGRAGAGWK